VIASTVMAMVSVPRLAGHLLARKAEDAGRRVVHEGEGAVRAAQTQHDVGLALDQIAVAALADAQRLLGGEVLGHVGVGAEPQDDALRVADRQCPRQEPAVLPVLAAHGEGVLPGLAGLARALKARHDALQVVGMVDGAPAPALHLLESGAGEVVPALVVPEDPAVRPRHPGELRDAVGHCAKALLLVGQGVGHLVEGAAQRPQLVTAVVQAGAGGQVAVRPAVHREGQGGHRVQQDSPRHDPGAQQRQPPPHGDEQDTAQSRPVRGGEGQGAVHADGDVQPGGFGRQRQVADHPVDAVDAQHLDRARPGGGEQGHELGRHRLADPSPAVRIAGEDGAVAVGDDESHARRQRLGQQIAAQPIQIERRADHAGHHAVGIVDGIGDVQAGPPALSADHVVANGEPVVLDRQPEPCPVDDVVAASRLAGAHALAADVDGVDQDVVRELAAQALHQVVAGVRVEVADGADLGQRGHQLAGPVDDVAEIAGQQLGVTHGVGADIGEAGAPQIDLVVRLDRHGRQQGHGDEHGQAGEQRHRVMRRAVLARRLPYSWKGRPVGVRPRWFP
jgi:hypothetical protein